MELMERSELRARTRVGEKGRIVIPAEMREALGLAAGGVLDLRVVDGELRYQRSEAAFGVRRSGRSRISSRDSVLPTN